ncbi:B12-binding domain-containing radical SAM protein [Anatilimnocola floriformis]|uniref:B12-binding domain-containing radical SAM protein n=1 Tax=Anatilimnocola floriformis TaxID=2948575 RepID=UPI0020C2A2F7|nr:B12-binding domain-containing radical SAM protein [Anatilimnocola floriformis]
MDATTTATATASTNLVTTSPAAKSTATKKFYVELIKPSHYDDDGYVIQWWRAFVPSNSLACMFGIVRDCDERKVLGDNTEIVINAYDECHTIVPIKQIIKRIQANDGQGVVFMTGVQSNQFPRTADICRELRAAGIKVVIGGFHVSGCLSMLPELPADIKAVQDLGVSLFAGEAEGRMEDLLKSASAGTLKPIYNYLNDLPDMQKQVTPFLPTAIAKKYMYFTAFDAGRGCPFQCSFCTIINVQGRKSRHRDADDVEKMLRQYVANGITQFFITDDNMARNKNWEAIFDRIIELKKKEKWPLRFVIQVDTMCHKIPNFVEKATAAGVNRVFIGMENINPDNLVHTKKFQNRITEYRKLLQAWRNKGVVTIAGYILGFPADTPESIKRDIAVIQKELPIDILEFFILTPLPGSADHQKMHREGVVMDQDMNKYDLEHVTTSHSKMSDDEWQQVYRDAWHQYYSPEHIETLMRRAETLKFGAEKVKWAIATYYGSYRYEHVHPLQCGVFRHKVRTTRRSDMPVENPLVFYAKRAWEIFRTYAGFASFTLYLERMHRKIKKNAAAKQYTDLALTPVVDSEEEEALQIYSLTEAAKNVAAKTKALASRGTAPVAPAAATKLMQIGTRKAA